MVSSVPVDGDGSYAILMSDRVAWSDTMATIAASVTIVGKVQRERSSAWQRRRGPASQSRQHRRYVDRLVHYEPNSLFACVTSNSR